MKLMSIAGARPNFMKLAAIAQSIKKYNEKVRFHKILADDAKHLDHIIVHTGQHYDRKMSQQFFEELEIPLPAINLEVGSGTHAIQTAEIMMRFEPVLMLEKPDVLLVVGDVNSTIACALVASKIVYPFPHRIKKPLIAHVEAGLRSFDREMPEEINRILTDSLSDLLFVTETSGIENLKREGIDPNKVHFVGNVMIDTLEQHLLRSDNSTIRQQLKIESPYCLATLHRPSNVDSPELLNSLVITLIEISSWKKIVFAVHPRTEKSLLKEGLYTTLQNNKNIILTPPLGYLDFLNLLKNCELVITDSGGIQEETTVLNIPCVTLRNNTERPVTVSQGSNYLVGTNQEKILAIVKTIFSGNGKKASCPEYWDGKAGDRIVEILIDKVKCLNFSYINEFGDV